MPIETDGLTLYIREVTEAQANPQKVSIRGQATTPLRKDRIKFRQMKMYQGSGIGIGKLMLNNDVAIRVGEYSGNRNRQNQVNNVRKLGNALLNIGGGAVAAGPLGALTVGAYQVYGAITGNLDYLNGIRKDDVRADVKIDASNGVLINNSIYKRSD